VAVPQERQRFFSREFDPLRREQGLCLKRGKVHGISSV
jgi:hypothetical protein